MRTFREYINEGKELMVSIKNKDLGHFESKIDELEYYIQELKIKAFILAGDNTDDIKIFCKSGKSAFTKYLKTVSLDKYAKLIEDHDTVTESSQNSQFKTIKTFFKKNRDAREVVLDWMDNNLSNRTSRKLGLKVGEFMDNIYPIDADEVITYFNNYEIDSLSSYIKESHITEAMKPTVRALKIFEIMEKNKMDIEKYFVKVVEYEDKNMFNMRSGKLSFEKVKKDLAKIGVTNDELLAHFEEVTK